MEELLQEIAEEKKLEAGPSERILSKEECYKMLRDKELTTGSMLGMYKWAAGLGKDMWNCELNWDAESISLLDAYD